MVKMTKTTKLEQVRAKIAKLASQQQQAAPLKAVVAKQVVNGDAVRGRTPQALTAQLAAQGRMVPQQTAAQAGENTVADDAPVQPAVAAFISAQEALVRPVLALFGISYDELIATDGKSLYGQALAARPELAAQVMASPSPVLAALAIAVGFKPYADFTQQYGSSLAEVKQKMKAEMLNELRGKGQEPVPAAGSSPATLNVVFAGMRVGGKLQPKKAGRASLNEVFGR